MYIQYIFDLIDKFHVHILLKNTVQYLYINTHTNTSKGVLKCFRMYP